MSTLSPGKYPRKRQAYSKAVPVGTDRSYKNMSSYNSPTKTFSYKGLFKLFYLSLYSPTKAVKGGSRYKLFYPSLYSVAKRPLRI